MKKQQPSSICRALTLLALLSLGGSCSSSTRQPDVILIVVDTLRADHMSLFGYGRETTPELARIAERGTVFSAAFSGSSWTMPSTVMLLSGAYDGRNGGALDHAWPSLAESFQGAGYRTAATLANPILVGQVDGAKSGSGFDRGFDEFDVVPRRFGLRKGEKRQTNGWYGGEVVRRAKTVLEEGSSKPTFLWLQLFDPHFPRAPRDPSLFAGSAAPSGSEALALSGQQQAAIDNERRLYDAEVHGADAAIGQLIDWLQTEGRLEHTVIVVTADHGEGLWQRPLPAGEEPKKKNPVPALYSDHGIMLTDEQIHVPLLVLGPGVPEGERVATPVSLVDVAPTLRRLANLPVAAGPLELSGRDLFGQDPAAPHPVYSFCSRGSSVLIAGRWRLIVPSEARARDHGDVPLLFDMPRDPLQLEPVTASTNGAPDIEQLSAALMAFRTLATPQAQTDDEHEAARRELLDDLGYVDQ